MRSSDTGATFQGMGCSSGPTALRSIPCPRKVSPMSLQQVSPMWLQWTGVPQDDVSGSTISQSMRFDGFAFFGEEPLVELGVGVEAGPDEVAFVGNDGDLGVAAGGF